MFFLKLLQYIIRKHVLSEYFYYTTTFHETPFVLCRIGIRLLMVIIIGFKCPIICAVSAGRVTRWSLCCQRGRVYVRPPIPGRWSRTIALW